MVIGGSDRVWRPPFIQHIAVTLPRKYAYRQTDMLRCLAQPMILGPACTPCWQLWGRNHSESLMKGFVRCSVIPACRPHLVPEALSPPPALVRRGLLLLTPSKRKWSK